MSSQRDNASCLESLETFLEHSIQPLILEGILSIREQAREISQQNNSEMDETDVTVQLLKDVKNWTQVLLDEEVRRILQKIPFLQKLLTALFVMKVKVLSVINMRKDTEEFPLTIPANATFLHHVYIQCANILIDNRSVLEEMNLVELSPLVKQGIQNACLACIEWSDLLSWGLDGVNVNDVVRNIMNDEEEKNENNTDEENAGEENSPSDDTSEAEFMNIANENKMNTGDDDDNQSINGDESNKNDDGESMFDFSDTNNENNNDSVSESVKNSADGSSVSQDDTSSLGDSASQVTPETTPSPALNQDERRVSSNMPSFF
uniref:Uncharacterized protein n=1 Tax=viral metagenome TaxID=1070528 RepID=A0A6C0J340_9ZZZZ